jgi:hypothetical protein
VDCDSPCADRVVVLNAIISSKVKALLIPVISLHFPNLSFSCMTDCGSSHCFIDSHYAKVNNLHRFYPEDKLGGQLSCLDLIWLSDSILATSEQNCTYSSA